MNKKKGNEMFRNNDMQKSINILNFNRNIQDDVSDSNLFHYHPHQQDVT